ncbi:MAG: lytic transglycosylase domain-containing protein [Pseudomonadota bacterium]
MRRFACSNLMVLMLCLCSCPLRCEADIYKWIDPHGVTHFTNMPNNKSYRLIIRSRRELITRLGGDEKKYETLIQGLCKKYKIDTALVKAVIKAESDFDPQAVSKSGAQGLMQLMPATAQDLQVSDSFDPRDNLDGGISYLRKLLDMFNGNLKLALAAYNAGENAVIANNFQIPPYPETQNYVRKVLNFLSQYQ